MIGMVHGLARGLAIGSMFVFATLPSTSNYKLQSYGFGSGGTANSQTTTYSLEGTSGELNGNPSSTTTSIGNPGFIQTQQANVPKIAIDTNSGSYYNKIHFVIDPQGNPSDATYLVAVSTDNFATNLQYVKPDGTLTSTLSTTNYQTYAAWGGASGSLAIGLTPSTTSTTSTYYFKALATQGNKTQSAYGPVVNIALPLPTISFNLVTSNQTNAPFSISLGALSTSSVTTSTQTINTTFSTDGSSGGTVYVTGKNGGLSSASSSYLIPAVSNDLTAVTEGYGATIASALTQTSGGPFSAVSPYNNGGTVVGTVDTTTRSLFTSSAPITGGFAKLQLEARAKTTTAAATDYTDVLTFTAAGNY